MSRTVVSNRFRARDADEQRREVVTPEGVPVVFHVARLGDRGVALLMDGGWILLGVLAVMLVALFAAFGGGGVVFAAANLGFFALRNFYFVWFESRWQGRTPGKRKIGLRVVDAGGGVLRTEALIVRNLTREVELFLPLVLISNPEVLVEAAPPWVQALSVVWLIGFMSLPLLNKERRRIGDLIAGTMVVNEPTTRLLDDLASEPVETSRGKIHFTAEQLEVYGVYELQVLETVLREEVANSESMRVVADKVREKIGWVGEGRVKSHEFLSAFYEAQRARLEHDLLLGRARERKG